MKRVKKLRQLSREILSHPPYSPDIAPTDYHLFHTLLIWVDQVISYYSCPRKSIRWYKKIIFHLLDVTVSNAYYIYRKKNERETRKLY
ncbi:hypothetical protein WH47_08073 [Habropoda laboriosa]|uniref:Histone-lysine N-methyltransferase SETMAR n=1 Tax=Habropoda laboriosa TaxID=597456 RepID=A0A0L7QPE2_9HYME|nr:hypothetical protein WH47_08073 [Habropoda laboriosa]